MPLPATFRATAVLPSVALPLVALPLAVILSTSAAVAQTAPATQPGALAKQADAAQEPAKPKVEKSQRLDKHAAPWTVIWHTRLWTEVPETQEFVKATHPDPKTLKYEPLVGKDPVRPKPRDAKGIAALQAELEGDLAHNAVRGKAINDIGAPKAAKKAASKSAHARKTAKAAPASQPSKPD